MILILSQLFFKVAYFKIVYYIILCIIFAEMDETVLSTFIWYFVHHAQRIYLKRYAYVTFDCVYAWSPSGGSVRHTFRVPRTGFPWDKIQGRGWNIATALIVALSLVRTSAKQMSHRGVGRPMRTYQCPTSLAKIISLGWNKSYLPLSTISLASCERYVKFQFVRV